MYLLQVIASIAILFSTGSTFPLDGTTSRLSGQQLSSRGLPGAVYICDEVNFGGNCGWSEPTKDCHTLGIDILTQKLDAKSIGPDPGGACVLYATGSCTGSPMETIRFPGTSNIPSDALGLRCSADLSASSEANAVQKANLAGGQGSKMREILDEKLGGTLDLGEGLIGLEKAVYY